MTIEPTSLWQKARIRGYAVIDRLFSARAQRLTFINNQQVKGAEMRPMVTSDEFNTPPKLIYLHVPKTAGTAFTSLCELNYPNATAITRSGLFEPETWKSARVVGGHFQFVCYEAAGPGHVYIAVLRDPVERALSLFRWYAQRELNRDYREQQGFDHSSLRNTLKKSIFHMEFLHNPQCRYLSHTMSFDDTLALMKTRPFIVGTFEQLGDWVETLAGEFGWSTRNMPIENRISTSRPSSDDKKLLSILRRHNREDQLLYDHVRKKGVFNSLPADFDRGPFRP